MVFRANKCTMEHADDLKNVIKRWIKAIPFVSVDKPCVLTFGILTGYKNGINPFSDPFVLGSFSDDKVILGIEEEYVFGDLLFHMDKQSTEIVTLWNSHKAMLLKQYNTGYELVLEIVDDFMEQVKHQIGVEQFNITKYGIEVCSISEFYLNVIFNASIIYAKGDTKGFFKSYENFRSCIRHDNNTTIYSIPDLPTGYITIKNGLLGDDAFRIKMDRMLMWSLEQAKTGYNYKAKVLVGLIGEINRSGEHIKALLSEQLLYQSFKGRCKYDE